MVKKLIKVSTKKKSISSKLVSKNTLIKILNDGLQKYYKNDDFIYFAECLSKVLELKQISISDLSNATGISRMQVYNIVTAKKEPKVSTLFHILKAVEIGIKAN